MPTDSQETSYPVIVSLANQKGGVGKTTSAVNLAAGLALQGYQVLLLDLDIQANATHILHRPLDEGELCLAEVILEEAKLDDIIVESSMPGVSIACSGETMVRVDLALSGMLGREEALKRALEESERFQSFDFVIIDTSPYLGLITVNALVTSDYVIIPISCEYLPMLGLKLFRNTITTVQKRLNHKLQILGYLLTMYDRRENITFEVENMMRKHFGDKVFKFPIRVNTHHKSSPAYGQTIFQYENKNGRGVKDYRHLTSAVLERVGYPASKEQEEPKQEQAQESAKESPKEEKSTAPEESAFAESVAEATPPQREEMPKDTSKVQGSEEVTEDAAPEAVEEVSSAEAKETVESIAPKVESTSNEAESLQEANAQNDTTAPSSSEGEVSQSKASEAPSESSREENVKESTTSSSENNPA